MTMRQEEKVIQMAYQAHLFTPSQESFRRGQQKKTYNPIHTTPTVNRVITHMAGKRDLDWARRQARRVVLDAEAGRFVDQLHSWSDLREFLATISLFLKTTGTKERKAMRSYVAKGEETLSSEEIARRALRISEEIGWNSKMNRNKLTRFTARVRAAQGKWECLAVLAQYYPLDGVPERLVNRLVEELEVINLESFKELVSHILVFYSASDARLQAKQGR